MTEPLDAHTRRLARHVGFALPVLVDPAAASRATGGPDPVPLRSLAGHVRQHTVDHLDHYLATASASVERGGGHVHWAADAAAARAVVRSLAVGGATVAASPVVAEVGVTGAAAGDAVAIVGAAFVVAQTGQVCLVGGAAEAAAPVLVVLAGLEAVVPRAADLAVMLKVTTQAAPAWAGGRVAVVGASRTVHLVWVDNGRTDLLAGEFRPALRCVGCGACTAVCPVYRSVDAKPAGLWAGPIGAVVLPIVRGADELPHASTLCGACADVCPVRIDLPTMLVALRRRRPAMARRLRRWAWVVRSPGRYRWLARWGRRPAGWPPVAGRSFHQLWKDRQTRG